MFIQNSGDVPKYRASRKAVSAEMPRRWLRIAVIRLGGTDSASARARADMANSFISSLRSSPGWIGRILFVLMVPYSRSMIIDNLHIARSVLVPLKADPPLGVDADAVLSLAVAGESLEAIARQSSEGNFSFFPGSRVLDYTACRIYSANGGMVFVPETRSLR